MSEPINTEAGVEEPSDPDGDVVAPKHGKHAHEEHGTAHQIGPERQHIWDAQPGDEEKIREHLDRQRDVPEGRVKLDDGRIVDVGSDAEGEGDDCDERD